MNERISTLRKRIDALDRELVRLLGRRARCSLEIGRMKQTAGLRLFSHSRERQIAENVRRTNRGPLPDHILVELYDTLLRLTRRAVRQTLHSEKRRAKTRRVQSRRKGRK